MSSYGYQLKQANTSTAAVTIAANAAILFEASNLYDNPDPNISYTAGTGTFTFAASDSYFITWHVNMQSSPDTEAKFSIQIKEGETTTDNYSSTIFNTGQLTGSALITPAAAATMQLVNIGSSTATLAIGNGIETAGISIFPISGLSSINGVTGYLDNTITSVAADALVPFNHATTTTGISIDTTTTKGEVTITKAGTYTVDFSIAVSGAIGAIEYNFQLLDNAQTPNKLGAVYAPVLGSSIVTGTAVFTVTSAQVTSGFKFGLYNKTVNTDAAPAATAISLISLTQRASIRVTGTY